MMEKLQQEIFDLIDGLLPVPKRKEVENFLESNKEAADFYTEMKVLRNRLGSLKSVKISPEFDAELRARIRMEKRLGRSTIIPDYVKVPSLAFAGAATVMLLFLAFGPTSQNIAGNPQTDVPAIIQNAQDSQQTYYTLDKIDLGSGTPVSSEGQRQAVSSRDSIRSNDEFQRHIRVVEF